MHINNIYIYIYIYMRAIPSQTELKMVRCLTISARESPRETLRSSERLHLARSRQK